MKRIFKRFLTTPFVCLIVIISLLVFPVSASAEAGTLGTETPALSFVFTDSNGKNADGNRLVAGKYKVDIVLSGMQTISVIELTGTYDTSVLSSMAITGIYADTHTDMYPGVQKVENGAFSVFQVAENETASTIDSNGTVMVSLAVTVASSCDFADVFAFSTDPNQTFVEATYADGYDDCYVLDTSIEALFKTYPMTVDYSPYYVVTEFDVSGMITVAGDINGASTDAFLGGITVSVYGTDIKAVTDDNGSYTLPDLTAGEYNLIISGPTTIDRNVKLIVDGKYADYDQITVDSVGVVIADYNRDGRINSTDAMLFCNGAYTYSIYSDYNSDGIVDEVDASAFKTFFKQTIDYTPTTLK